MCFLIVKNMFLHRECCICPEIMSADKDKYSHFTTEVEHIPFKTQQTKMTIGETLLRKSKKRKEKKVLQNHDICLPQNGIE